MQRMIGVLAIGFALHAAHAQPPPPATVAERAEFYQRIAGTSSTAELERLARALLEPPLDAAQRVRLELIVERYYEVDRSGALGFARELRREGGPDFVALLYDRLARDDVNDALTALSLVDDPAEARHAAQMTFTGLGGDERAYDLVAASLQSGPREQFRADALPQLAARSPHRAFEEALALADAEKRAGLAHSVIARWANDSESEALAAVNRVPDPELQAALRGTVLRSWRDQETLADYLATLGPESLREALVNGGLDRLVQTDPRRAGELAAALPPGDDRHRLLMQIGSVYVHLDAEAAVAWARALAPPEPELLNNMVRNIALQDPVRAFDIASTLDEPARSQGYAMTIGGPIADGGNFTALANRMLRIADEQTRTGLLTALIGSAANHPDNVERVLEWMLANDDAVPAAAFEGVGLAYARANPSAAAVYVDRVPNAARAGWITALTAVQAATDLQGAAAFLERFRGEPAFDRAAEHLAQQMAAVDPPAAARLLASVRARGAGGVGPEVAIARSWAQSDAPAAAAWALDLPPMQRSIALSIVTGTWGQQDPDAVRDWALRVPAGDTRDQALMAAARARGAAPPDPVLLAAFSNDRAREGAVMNMIPATAQADIAAARRLIDAYIADPGRRRQAEEIVESIANGTAPLPSPAFGVSQGAINAIRPLGTTPTGVVTYGQPVTIIGPNGQPVTVQPSPFGVMPPPGSLPPGVRPPVPVSPVTGLPVMVPTPAPPAPASDRQ